MAAQSVNLKFENDKELTKLFSELTPKIQNKIVIGGFRMASKIIANEAKSNLKSRTNIKTTGGNKGVKIQKLARNKIGVKLGFQNYKLRWIEWGTDERHYKKGNHRTGKIKATHFFFDAVETTLSEANDKIENSIKESFNKTIIKYGGRK